MIKPLSVAIPGNEYKIHFTDTINSDVLSEYISGKCVFIVTDSNVAELHLASFAGAVRAAGAERIYTLSFQAGEKSKTFDTVLEICRTAAKKNCNRKTVFIALGGGVAGDMTGFASAIFMRGAKFIQVPTTLLAAVDASVGGKTGCDLPEGKNLIGAFHQPETVIICGEYLKTLPLREYYCGCAEIVKTAAIADKDFFAELEKNADLISARDSQFIMKMIQRCCEIKAGVVAKDEKENSLRAILNFGHTFGHAFESVSDFTLPHGEAVACGIAFITEYALKKNFSDSSVYERLKKLLSALHLPAQPPDVPKNKIFDAILRDKKSGGDYVNLILVPELGRAEIVKTSYSELKNYLGLL